MQKVIYGVCGEGLGHATRAFGLVQSLPEVEFHIATYGQALTFFQKVGHPYLHQIHGLRFSYSSNGVNYLQSAWKSLRALSKMPEDIRHLKALANAIKPSLFLTDFEPVVPRVAHAFRRPLLSIDNQHKFAYCKLNDLTWRLRLYGWGVWVFCRLIVPWPDHAVVSTFHYDLEQPLRRGLTLVNGLIRPELEREPIADDGYVLTYVRPSVSEIILRALLEAGDIRPVKVFGEPGSGTYADLAQRSGHIRLCGVTTDFPRSLARCHAVIATAGNQLLSECRFLGKPTLVVPEPWQFEQHVNAYYAKKLGVAQAIPADALSGVVVRKFLEEFRPVSPRSPNGLHTVSAVIRHWLELA